MVVLDGASELLAKPRHHRARQPRAGLGVLPEDAPFLFVWPAPFVENRGRDRELADIVENCRPAKPVAIIPDHLHLVAQHLGEEAHPLRVSAGSDVVGTQSQGEDENNLGSLRLFRCLPQHESAVHLALQVPGARPPARDRKSRGRGIGKCQ